ncbi:MAG: hypothetical protein ABIR96_11945 [Bdellovibrionota bacterium]
MKRFLNSSSFIGLLYVVALAPALAHAIPEDVARIFDKKQRQLQGPPSSLRSDETSNDSRYFSGVNRLQRRVGSTTESEETPLPAASGQDLEVSKPVQAPPSGRAFPQQQPKVVIVREGSSGNGAGTSRQQRREQRIGNYAFDGNRIFGVGFVGAGSYGIFGAEADFGFGNNWAGGIGIGTGMAYASWGFHARHYFQTGNLTPYFQVGYANWTIHHNPYRESEIYPGYLGEQFLQNKDGSFKVNKSVHLIYPALGVLFQSESGLAFTMQIQYLISALDFKGALAGGFGLHFYF